MAPEPGTKADPNFRQLLCIGLTVTYEKATLTRKKNTIKIHAKHYESATTHSMRISKTFRTTHNQNTCSVHLHKFVRFEGIIVLHYNDEKH